MPFGDTTFTALYSYKLVVETCCYDHLLQNKIYCDQYKKHLNVRFHYKGYKVSYVLQKQAQISAQEGHQNT